VQVVHTAELWAHVARRAVLLKVGAKWCGPCRVIQPAFAALAAANPGVAFLEADGDTADKLAHDLSVTALPTFLLFLDGQHAPTDRLTGANQHALANLAQKASWGIYPPGRSA
jgi:thioredoxin 1